MLNRDKGPAAHPGGRRSAVSVWVAWLMLGVLAAAVAAGTGITVAVARESSVYADRIYPGVSISGMSVGGFTREEAEAAVRALAARRLHQIFTLRVDTERVGFTQEQLGLVADSDQTVAQAYAIGHTGPSWTRLLARLALVRRPVEVGIAYHRDRAAITGVLAPLAERIAAEAVQEAALTVRRGLVVLVRPSRNGRVMNLAATATITQAALAAGFDETDAAVAVRRPAFTTDEAQEITALLTAYTTSIAGSENRLHNIALAASFVRGTILSPGGVFSYNTVVGPRITARGFKEAPILIDDELVPGDGGGVCQVSSTLFNVALLADLEVLSRTNHARPVAYLPIGRDATVNYGALDLQFKNTTGHHLLLWAQVTGRWLTLAAYGAPDPLKTVSVLVSEREVIPPPAHTVTKADPELDVGKVVTREALPGYRVQTYRVVKRNGAVVKRELIATSVYHPVPRTIKVGAKKPKQIGARP